MPKHSQKATASLKKKQKRQNSKTCLAEEAERMRLAADIEANLAKSQRRVTFNEETLKGPRKQLAEKRLTSTSLDIRGKIFKLKSNYEAFLYSQNTIKPANDTHCQQNCKERRRVYLQCAIL